MVKGFCSKCNVELILGDTVSKGRTKHSTCNRCHASYQASINTIKNPIVNKLRMFVDGRYVSRTHPLYKPGRYKSFNDAAFSSLVNYVLATEGEVYVLKNPAWSNWYKIGKAIESVDRCNQYQTSSPHRDYEIVTYKKFKHREPKPKET